jgi:GrpB-like predicted nucleotidyltransferase (UPF0157 family)
MNCSTTTAIYIITFMTATIEPYNPEWKTEFENIKQIIESEFKDSGIDINIQHVGSTAIPGLVAKPILDLDIIIPDKSHFNKISSKLEKLGYKNKGEQGIPDRIAFRQTTEATPFLLSNNKKKYPHHLYVCLTESLAVKNHLLFRDALLSNKELSERYSQLKLALIGNQPISREEYTKRKTEFIISVLAASGLGETELKQIRDANR